MNKLKKALVVFVIVVSVLLTCMLNVHGAASQSDAVAWVKGKIGVGISYYGNGSYQCVDLIYSYYNWLGASAGYWNACDYISNTLPSGWQRITNYSGFAPQPGDVAVWKTNHSCDTCSTGWAGHVGIVTSGNSSTFVAVNQNYDNRSYCTSNQFNTSALQCVIRPSFTDSASGVSVTWVSNPEEVVESTDALLSHTAELSGVTNTSVTEARMYLYNYKGSMLDYIIEDTASSPDLGGQSTIDVWYHCQKDLGYTLSPGTVYKYKFSIKIKGVSYESPMMEITTTGTHSHAWNSGSVTTAATCGKSGVRTYTCTTCGETKTSTIAATGNHTAEEWSVTKAPSCTASGTKVQKCTVCGTTLASETVSAEGHTWNAGVITTAPTCTNTGVKTYTCNSCFDTKTETVAATGNHTVGDWVFENAPTCIDAGTRIKKCTVCKTAVKTENVEATGHSYDSSVITEAPTCVDKGILTYTCGECGANKTEDIVATGVHVYGEWKNVNEGEHRRICTLCEKSESGSHRWDSGILTLEPSDDREGLTTYNCMDCSASKTNTVPATHVHEYSEQWSSGENTHWYACSCGARKDETGHVPGDEATEYTNCVCTACGYVIVSALGHTHTYDEEWNSDENEHWHECACGENSNRESHEWGAGKITLEPTESAEGEKKFTCSVCLTEKTEKIGKLLSENGQDGDVIGNDGSNGNRILILAVCSLVVVNLALLGFIIFKKVKK